MNEDHLYLKINRTVVVDLLIEEHNREEVKELLTEVIDLIYDGEYTEGDDEYNTDTESTLA